MCPVRSRSARPWWKPSPTRSICPPDSRPPMEPSTSASSAPSSLSWRRRPSAPNSRSPM
ncbi:hypothetical protein ONE63_006270 [Megalurothrips usitatus]|uniref:Uncharacterized protein n=1 Tax=Megalurothrips usitatus TaxID=439358 RepID=A0AAV7XVF9_9NEOP|nr:hypothetical protein ONE63_006270 [Megalurothrips usitatus]